MSSYQSTAGGPDRAKAIAAVVAVHAALAFVILSGLNVRIVNDAVEQLKTFNLQQPPPPPVPPKPKPQPQQAMKKPAGAPAKAAEPTPVVAPPPRIPAPSPIPAAKVAGSGSSPNSGAAAAGNGTGAGGAGNGRGGGGYGDYSRFTPARLISNIPNSQYGQLAATGIPSGLVGVRIMVGPDGSVSSCRIARSSGEASIDALVCDLTRRYVRFSPARDPDGRPVAQEITYYPNWRRR
jgi:periplasmic protein TonB